MYVWHFQEHRFPIPRLNVGVSLQRKLSRLAPNPFAIAVVLAIIALAPNNFSNNSEFIIQPLSMAQNTIPYYPCKLGHVESYAYHG